VTTSTDGVRRWVVVAVTARAVAVVAGIIASPGEVRGWEQSIFHAVNDLPD
jgi:hypothetical protein